MEIKRTNAAMDVKEAAAQLVKKKDDRYSIVNFRVEKDFHRMLKLIASDRDMKVSELIRELLERHIEEIKHQAKKIKDEAGI